jgi:catechol 2,3-dioxygenase-like lactoylglutathione lyase family enzyme
MPHFREVHPTIGVLDVEQAIAYYVERLGFRLAFRDPSAPDKYAGVRRDGVELHLQWQSPEDMPKRGSLMLRLFVDDPDALYAEYRASGALAPHSVLRDTPWGTREFAFFAPDGTGLTFYRDLAPQRLEP